MKKTKTLKEKGITLIALVITIIVLLILAWVSIAMLMGENGILTQANNAKIEQSHGTVKDSIALAYNEWQIELNTASTTKLASTEVVQIQGKEEHSFAVETDFLAWLVLKGYADSTGKINVENLTGGKQALGNGTDNDIYKIEKQDENYVLNYIGTDGNPQEIWSAANQEESKPSLGKLADVVKVGDYVNYAPTYENTSSLKEGLGNGWRVAYVEDGVVTLISEGVPLTTNLHNSSNDGDSTTEIKIDFTEVNKLMDNKVANNIEIPEIEHMQEICNQAGCTMTHKPKDNYSHEEYTIENDEINIISIGTNYVLNNMSGESQYNTEAYFVFSHYNNKFTTDKFCNGISGLRVVVDLKSNLDYYGGTGSQSDPYQIY